MIDENLRKTFEKTAEALTGKAVILHFHDPLARNARGDCYTDTAGIIRINISPSLSAKDAFTVALEEIAHAKLSHFQTPMTEGQYKLSAAMDAREVNRTRQETTESPARALAAKWQDRAQAITRNLIRWFTPDTERAVIYMTALKTLSELKEI